ncbi:hypothetical protein DXG01_011521 [Tephrocybe rancida]|nr:hypothetical protein DXG01_011521 [Tephrocybe rancida]
MSPVWSDPEATQLPLLTTHTPSAIQSTTTPMASTSPDDFIFPAALFSSPKESGKKTKRAPKPKNPLSKLAANPEEPAGRSKHNHMASGTKEVIPLTVGEDRKQVADVYGNPVGKENARYIDQAHFC